MTKYIYVIPEGATHLEVTGTNAKFDGEELDGPRRIRVVVGESHTIEIGPQIVNPTDES